MDRVRPRRLRRGGLVRVVAPASGIGPLAEEAVDTGVRNLESLGLRVEISIQVRLDHHGAAGTTAERSRALEDAFADPEVDAVMCLWGGWNSNDLLGHLDLDTIRDNPKPFIGFSDVTVLNNALLGSAGLVNFQGPAFVTFTHPFLLPWEVDMFRGVVMEGRAPREVHASPAYVDDPYYYLHPDRDAAERPNRGWRVVREGRARGALMGGHLESLLTLAGTRHWPSFQGSLLFLEVDEAGGPCLRVLRALRHLEQLGVFDEAAGVLLGRTPEAAGVSPGLGELVSNVVGGRDVPVVDLMDIGHTNPIMTIPVGAEAEIDTDGGALTLLEAGVV